MVALRKATADDVDLLIRLRLDFINIDGEKLSADDEAAVRIQLASYLPKHIADGTFVAVLAEIDGRVVSTAYMAIAEKPAGRGLVNGSLATLHNVLTYPEFRRRGIATQVIEEIIRAAREARVDRIDLSATESGAPLYAKLGFAVSTYTSMNLKIN